MLGRTGWFSPIVSGRPDSGRARRAWGGRLLLAPLLLATLVRAGHAGPGPEMRRAPLEDGIRSGAMFDLGAQWPGGSSSLPLNMNTPWQQLRDQALTLEGVQAAIQSMESRGYVRRADRDTAYSGLGVSGVVLSYEIPGVPIMERQPVVFVQCQAMPADFGLTGYTPTLVIGSLTLRDSLLENGVHVPVPDRTPGSEPMLIEMEFQQNGQPVGPEATGDGFEAYYSMREGQSTPINTVRKYLPKISDQETQWIYGLCNQIRSSAFGGLIGGAITGFGFGGLAGLPPGMLFGLMGGALSGAASYVASHPYPVRSGGASQP